MNALQSGKHVDNQERTPLSQILVPIHSSPDNSIQERPGEEEEESDLSFEKIFGEELKILGEADRVCQNKETVLDNCCFELNFEKLFLDELRFLENKQQPNFYTSTMNLGVEKIVKEKLVVREQTFTNQESKSNMHDTNNTYLPLPQKSLNTPECLEF